jgi:hypothetical protein
LAGVDQVGDGGLLLAPHIAHRHDGEPLQKEQQMPKRLFAVSVMSLISGAVMVGQNLVPACPVPKPTTIAACPLIGCSSRVADASLNQAKNRADISPTLDDVTVADIKALTQPTDWTTGQPRDSIAATEGWQVRITARLKSVKKEGAESCNCDIGTQVNTDVHLALVDRVADDESESVTAELTPRVRAAGSHTNWLASQLMKYQGKLVRLTGRVMLDTAHVHHSHLLPGENPIGPVNRATDWEIHPVTTFEVCASTIAHCRAGVGWKAVN